MSVVWMFVGLQCLVKSMWFHGRCLWATLVGCRGEFQGVVFVGDVESVFE